MNFVVKNLEETKKVAIDFGTNLKPNKEMATVIGLYGDLGSGKTTFMKYLAEFFGLQKTIQSPTFVIMKSYELQDSGFKLLYHIDAYRIEDPGEMLNLGWQEMLANPKSLICIEWPEKIADIMPPHIMIRFGHGEGSENQRKISIA